MLRNVLQPISDLSCNKSAGCFKTGLNEGGKTCDIAFHLVSQQCCKTSQLYVFVACFTKFN